MMKHLLTFTALLISSLAMGQFPNLPYNPDENGDGLIGVVDLQGLLANYGNEFASAVVSEDGESAIVYMGDMGYFECKRSCNQLPGFWSLPRSEDLVPLFPDLNITGSTRTWLSITDFKEFQFNLFPYYRGNNNNLQRYIVGTPDVGENYKCYCSAKQLPRVEYCMCTGDINNGTNFIQSCADEKVSEGWYPLGGLGAANGTDGQAFWRWAE